MPSRSSSRTSRRSTKTTSSRPWRRFASSRPIVVIRAFASSTSWRKPFFIFMRRPLAPRPHLLGVLGRVGHLLPVLADDAVGADPHRRADHALGLLAVHHLVAVGSPRRHDLAIGVGEQRERQPVLLRELRVRLARIRRDAEHHDARLLQILPEVAEPARLLGAAGRVVLGIEVDDDVLALEVGERDGLAARILQGELRRLASFRDRHGMFLQAVGRGYPTIGCSSATSTGERARSMNVRSSSTRRRAAALPSGVAPAATSASRLSNHSSATPSYASGPPRPRRSPSFTGVASVWTCT